MRGVLPVAVKVMAANLAGTDDSDARSEFLREVATLRALHSPSIVQFLGEPMDGSFTELAKIGF